MSKSIKNVSEIADFYRNKCILITGATGLIGKVLVWKLLTACKDVDRIFLLMRPLKGLSVNERLNDMLTRSRDLFKYQDAYKHSDKLVPVEGDIVKSGLGLSQKDRQVIIESVSVVIHSAADINFATKNLREQILINVGGTLEILDLCKQLKKLESFIHVSTAYCNPKLLVTEEKIYKGHVDPYEMLAIARNPDEPVTNERFLGNYELTYLFTKNLAENLVYQEWLKYKNQIPMAVVRPAVCLPTYQEPIRGWIDSLNGISGAGLAGAVGLVRTARVNLDMRGDAIALDIVANVCISVGWTTAVKYRNELRVYNVNSSCLNITPTAGEAQHLVYEFGTKFPLLKTVRPPPKPINSFWMLPGVFEATRFFSETCFAYACDAVLWVIGERRFVVKIVKRFQKITDVIQPLTNRVWLFTNNNFVGINYDQNPIDRKLFPCEVRNIDYVDTLADGYFTARRIFLMEKPEDVPRAQRQMRYLRTAYTLGHHFAALFVFLALFLLFPSINLSLGQFDLLQVFIGLVMGSMVVSLFQTWTFLYPKFDEIPEILADFKKRIHIELQPAQFPQFESDVIVNNNYK